MVVLKKIKGSTLVETLVATVLLVVVFMLASLILNNLFSNTIKNNTDAIDNYLNELEYQYKNGKIEIPYHDNLKTWDITLLPNKQIGQNNNVLLEAINTETKQTISQYLIEN